MASLSDKELRDGVLAVLSGIAPEVDPNTLRDGDRLRDEVDLDSMDFFRFLVGLHERFKVEIPEADSGRLTSLTEILAYLRGKI